MILSFFLSFFLFSLLGEGGNSEEKKTHFSAGSLPLLSVPPAEHGPGVFFLLFSPPAEGRGDLGAAERRAAAAAGGGEGKGQGRQRVAGRLVLGLSGRWFNQPFCFQAGVLDLFRWFSDWV